jgi:hypothetical protein
VKQGHKSPEIAKTKRQKASKRRASSPTARQSLPVASTETEFARLSRERDEALQEQAATSKVPSIIRRSPANTQPVFEAIVESAASLCGAIFSILYLYDGHQMRIAATSNFNPECVLANVAKGQ